ncbi:hypothetical protein CBR_g5761 [Chara braunii]|uniref:Uncharacterized protein n=1 Tax=Chara braunii TaxID=69332 RepID=A0A388KJ99_CHABU|nr:hypothetical protein CBR_g5761 [Chara braunii]|eukprot:GBG70131.1 hypothetical protein CBR_g5761 [Chara braunii]
MTKAYVLAAFDMKEDDWLLDASIRDEIMMKEKVFIDLWNTTSEFHFDLVHPAALDPGASEPESDDDLLLTEEERAFHEKFLADSSAQLAVGLAKEKTKDVNKFLRNAFLPIAPHRWIESEAKALKDKIWDFDTFNHLAPIIVNAYRFLTSLTLEELETGHGRALDENSELI